MNEYEALKNKWEKRRNNMLDATCFGLANFGPHKFVVYVCEEAGFAQAVMVFWTPAVFDSPKDVLAHYRFAQIPRLLKWDCSPDEDDSPENAEYYLNEYDSKSRKQIHDILNIIDNALMSEEVTVEILSSIRELHNKLFDAEKEICHQIIVWGNLTHVLKALFARHAEEYEPHEDDPDEVLKGLLDSGEFDEDNDDHLSLAKIFLEGHISA